MKNIIDFYECDLNTGNPANTIGMGNPKPPTLTSNGSEPLTIIKRNKKDKHKKQKIEEASLLDIDSNLDVTDKEVAKSAITQFINDNYKVIKFTISDEPNKDGKYEVSSKYSVAVKNINITSLTNDLFVWDKVKGNFECEHCDSLKSLEGAPKEVEGYFDCYSCESLTSLKGSPYKVKGSFNCYKCNSLKYLKDAPKEVGESFNCSSCESLKSLEGAPKEVGGTFNCYDCSSLKSLKGAPEKVGIDFICCNCKSLKSLEGAPKEVGGYFICSKCKIKFEVSDVEAVSNVRGEILV